MNRQRRCELLARFEHATEVPMLVLAVVFLVVIAVPELGVLSRPAAYVFESIGWLIWGAFAMELVVKTYLAPDHRHYLLTHWPDLLVVAVPFLRPLRLLRVVVARRFRPRIVIMLIAVIMASIAINR